MPPPSLHEISLILCAIGIVLKMCEYEWVSVRQEKVWIREFLFKNDDDDDGDEDDDDDDGKDDDVENHNNNSNDNEKRCGVVWWVCVELTTRFTYLRTMPDKNKCDDKKSMERQPKEVEHCKNENNLIFLFRDY